jgi:hypothetical protein
MVLKPEHCMLIICKQRATSLWRILQHVSGDLRENMRMNLIWAVGFKQHFRTLRALVSKSITFCICFCSNCRSSTSVRCVDPAECTQPLARLFGRRFVSICLRTYLLARASFVIIHHLSFTPPSLKLVLRQRVAAYAARHEGSSRLYWIYSC